MAKSFDLSSADGQHQLDLFLDGFLKDTNVKKEAPKPSKKAAVTSKTVKSTATTSKPRNEAKSQPQNSPKAKIIEFPKPVPDVEVKTVSGNASYEDCERKMKKELELFKDADSEYVITGLLELCKVDDNFRNCVMQENKSFSGAFDYMYSQAQQGVGAYKVGARGAIMEKDTALGVCINYYES